MDKIDITKEVALEWAYSFVDDHWKSLNEDDITIKILSGGYSGRLYIVEDISKTSHSNPTKTFLIRLYGGKLVEKDDVIKSGKSETSEGIVFYANGMHGLGPKLLGVFDGGRVEEYVPSHRLTEEDLVKNKQLLSEMARKLARFHALELPLSKKKRDLLYISATYQDKYNREKLNELVKCADLNPDIVPFLDKGYHSEHEFLRSYESRVGGRLVLCHGDLNKNNILVRDNPDQFNEQIMLIDYELAATDYRGVDLAGLVIGRMYEMNDDGVFKQVCEWPNEEYRRMIITEYLIETKKLNYFEFDEDNLDSVDHVLMEMDFFVLYQIEFYKGFLKKLPNEEYVRKLPPPLVKSMLDCTPLMNLHTDLKNHFVRKYSNLI